MIDWDIVWRLYIGITWSGALGVVASAVVLHLLFSLLVHIRRPAVVMVGGRIVLSALR